MSAEAATWEQPPATPKPISSGTFAIYQDTDGGLVLVAEIVGRGLIRRKIPAAMVRIMSGENGGGVAGKMMRKAFGGDE
jgi:hypothetical protein